MSVKEDGQYYTDDSFYADAGDHYVDIDKGHQLPGNTQEFVHVESRLFVYLKTFENFVSENPSVEYRNLARTGVKVKGYHILTMNKLFVGLGMLVTIILTQLLPNYYRTKTGALMSVYFSTDNSIHGIPSMKSLSLALESESIPDKFSQPLNNKKLF